MSNPVIKFNGGNPVYLCKKCRTITNYVKLNEDRTAYITFDGSEPKLYCNKCADLMASKKVIATIKSCVTPEHLEGAVKFLYAYLNEYDNNDRYNEMVGLLTEKRKEIEK
jgi:hypothetical protein